MILTVLFMTGSKETRESLDGIADTVDRKVMWSSNS